MEVFNKEPLNRPRRSFGLGSVLPLSLGLLVACGGRTYNPNPPVPTTTVLPLTSTIFPAKGAVASQVVVTGSYFDGATGITVNNVQAPDWSIVSDSMVTVTIPPAASTGVISVNTLFWGYQPSTTPFTVIPQITAITPTSGPAGTVVELTGYGFVGTTQVTFGSEGTPASSTFTPSINANQLTATVGVRATTGPVTLTASGITVTGPTFTIAD